MKVIILSVSGPGNNRDFNDAYKNISKRIKEFELDRSVGIELRVKEHDIEKINKGFNVFYKEILTPTLKKLKYCMSRNIYH